MIIVSIIVRNEVDRHLEKTLTCAREIVDTVGGEIRVTDDASTDNSVEMCRAYGAEVQFSPEPLFWMHEGRARQRHYDFSTVGCMEGDWILSLDADETINSADLLVKALQLARRQLCGCILMPLYEFWEPDKYRVDGFWFGTKASRLYAWQPGGRIADKEMGCGSEPTYVSTARPLHQDQLHLLHWGYLRPEDRMRKHAAYMERLGGHGHNMSHVESIVTAPRLALYPTG